MRNYNGLLQVLSRCSYITLLTMPISLIAAAPDPTTATLERSTIEDKYKWDLTKMYSSQQDWETHYKKLEGMIDEFAGKKGKVGESDASLMDALKLRDQINVQLEKIAGYTSLKRDED